MGKKQDSLMILNRTLEVDARLENLVKTFIDSLWNVRQGIDFALDMIDLLEGHVPKEDKQKFRDARARLLKHQKNINNELLDLTTKKTELEIERGKHEK